MTETINRINDWLWTVDWDAVVIGCAVLAVAILVVQAVSNAMHTPRQRQRARRHRRG